MSDKDMFIAACVSLGQISDALGIPSEDSACANGNGLILEAIAALIAERDALLARIASSCRADGQRVFDLLCIPVEFDGDVALVKLESEE